MSQFQPSRLLPLQPPPMQPQSQNGPQRPPAKPPARRVGFSWLWLASGLIVGLIVGIIIGYAVHTPGVQSTPPTKQTITTSSQSTQEAITPTPAHALKWTTIKTITGNSGEKTSVFTMPDDWKIVWSCDPKSFQGSHANLNVTVYGPPDGALVNVAVNAVCKPGKTSGSTEEHRGGQVFLVIGGNGSWKLQVQELK